jgi:hypothetical protein
MSTWRMEVEHGEEVEDETSCVRSRLARNATNFGMAAGASIHPGEHEAKSCQRPVLDGALVIVGHFRA